MDDKETISVSHFSMSTNFLHLVSNILEETVANGNIHTYWGTPREDIHEHYDKLTKWSDFRVMIPTLFLLFHGIELLLKGANYKIKLPKGKKPNHNLKDLFSEFKENYPSAIELSILLNKYIYPTVDKCPFLADLYRSNNFMDSSSFYELLKYPYSKNLDKYYIHSKIKFLNSKGVPFFKDILVDIETIREEVAKL